ncbi:ATP-binding protein [Virgibacillus kekensis]|uniref:histidine kinase n=1 Tax=Virgibacillus kekensis TaxID=202261 RepID=A0ABV9DG31_9BACI
MKLRTKIQLYSSLFMFVLVLAVNIAAYYFFYNMSTDVELEELNLLTEDVIAALNENPTVDPGDLMKAYLPGNGTVRVILENGVPVIEQTRSKEYQTLPWEFSDAESRKIIEQDNAPDIAVIEKPIVWPSGAREGEVVTIQISNRLVSLHETMRTLFYVLATLSILVLIPVIVAGAFLGRFLLSPIQNLIRIMRGNMTQGDWKKINNTNKSHDEIYEMEMTFNEMIDRIKVSYEKQEMFVSDASHELKTPIQVIKSYAQLLARRDTISSDLYKESFEAIDSETDRVKKLVDQMLALAKNKQLGKKENIKLDELATDAISRLQGVHGRDIRLITDGSEPIVYGSKSQLDQVISILIDNAIKYSETEIEVHVLQDSDMALLQVRDFGQGITEEEQKSIFDRFYRVDKARSRDTGGTGLGLSIAHAITAAHEGELSVVSDQGLGSTFTLRLALVNSE